MKKISQGLAAAIAALLVAPAIAAPVTRTETIDKPKFEINRTTTRDREAGSFTRDAEITRKADGKVTQRHAERHRTATGYEANQRITSGAGETLYNRDVAVSHANGQVTRSVDVTRKQGFHPPRQHHNGRGRRR
jgi:hypothetical protein